MCVCECIVQQLFSLTPLMRITIIFYFMYYYILSYFIAHLSFFTYFCINFVKSYHKPFSFLIICFKFWLFCQLSSCYYGLVPPPSYYIIFPPIYFYFSPPHIIIYHLSIHNFHLLCPFGQYPFGGMRVLSCPCVVICVLCNLTFPFLSDYFPLTYDGGRDGS